MDKTAIPKFGSFRPNARVKHNILDKSKTPHTPEAESRHNQENQIHRRESGSHDRTPRHRGHRREDRYRSRDHHDRHDTHDRAVPKDSKPSIAPDEFIEPDLFIVDRYGDSKNVEYGALHRYAVPAYRRTGNSSGNVLGVAVSYKIDQELSSEREAVLTSTGRMHHKKSPRLLTSKQGRPQEKRLRLVIHTSDVPTDSRESDYVELRPSRKRKRESPSPGREASSVDYRSIEGKAKSSDQPRDKDLAFASESEDEGIDDSSGLRARQMSALLSRNAKANPTHIDPWLALVDHQRELVQSGHPNKLISSSERRSLADLRLSILNEAATHITIGKPGRERLYYAILEEGAELWSGEKLSAKWKDALMECPTSVILWTKYLNYVQDDQSSFHFESCKDAYVSCLQILSRSSEQLTGDAKVVIGKMQIQVLLRLTIFFADAGYDELSLAIWQALFEYHFYMPPDLFDASLEQQLMSLEDFWENEAPRIGEDKAQGWAQYVSSGYSAKRTRQWTSATSLEPCQSIVDAARLEESLSHELILPAPVDNDDSITDPFRCVMFTDIRQIVKHLCKGLTRMSLLDGFLCYAGLPRLPLQLLKISAPDLVDDPHVCQYDRLYTNSQFRIDAPQSHLVMQNRRECTDTLFTTTFESSQLSNRALGSGDDRVRFLDRLLEAVCTALPGDEILMEYFLAFKLSSSPKAAARSAKRLLKGAPSSLRLYNAYALIMARLEDVEKALQVWNTAISMSTRLNKDAQHDLVLLWHSRLLCQVRNGQNNAALIDLLAIGKTISEIKSMDSSTTQDSQMLHLRVTRLLEEGFDHMQLTGRFATAAIYGDTLAWISYLSSTYQISAALQTYRRYAARLGGQQNSCTLELFYQAKATLLKLHIESRRPYRPATLRKEVEEALVVFPSNTILLELHATVTAQERLRSLVHEQRLTGSPMTIVQWMFKISEERRRAGTEFLGCTSNTIRATFSNALLHADTNVAHSPALWGMWLDFEYELAIRRGETLCKVKQVFVDGLRYLPWHKEWAVRGLNYLSDGTLTMNEIRQVYKSIIEHGLRIRVEVDDVDI